ncbi:hypothetical protein GYMLUDRAFT_437386 [Collybiopsis luxurians FD-317 M1]|uniref:Uncharacterized protein n=1 Tax=Collybiopsis luxurians FD-317 M1 TaxID=944289 RepID=A0A0D0CMC2_9AGAR|nr:hypothetical protein GYMLUDRAFT_437386 [Collybiopsis luxurians FD-317 M1]
MGMMPRLVGPFLMNRYYKLARVNLLFFCHIHPCEINNNCLVFALLRDLPEGALEEVQWDTFIPHV